MPKPIYVPIALPLAEAEAVFVACRAAFAGLMLQDAATSETGVNLARGMYAVAKATNKAREDAEGAESDAGAAA